MPAADPQSRGLRGKLRRPAEQSTNGQVKVIALSDVIEPGELIELIEAFHEEGWGLSVSRTRDGGAIAWGIMCGGKTVKRYTPTREAWQALCVELTD